jgi:hypothetical protein
LLRRAGIRSYDALHGLLEASPSLARVAPALGRDKLLAALRPLLSDAYRAALAAPEPPAPEDGAAPPRPPAGQVPLAAPIPAGWPAVGRAQLLGDEPADLLGDLPDRWPIRDQRGGPTCVGFASATAMERARPGADGTPPLLSALFVYQRIRQRGSLAFGAESGATKLGEARRVIAEEGICARAEWDDERAVADAPGDGVLAAARARRTDAIDYWDLPDPRRRPKGVARTVLDLLRQGRPVAVSLPVFRDPDLPDSAPNNWWQRAVRVTGVVADPLEEWRIAKAGHAVCVLAFQHDPTEPQGGWFIFRNSVGGDWAEGAPPARGTLPFVPDRGYGALSASHVERFVWEIFSPKAA